MTKEEKLQYIKAKVVEVCPEVMKKSFGCRIEYEGKKGIYIEHLKGFADTFKLDEQFKSTGMSIISNPNLKILGHPITLSHILRTIQMNIVEEIIYMEGQTGTQMNEVWSVAMDGFFEVRDPKTGIIKTGQKWDLTKDLDGQDAEFVDFLYQLIK